MRASRADIASCFNSRAREGRDFNNETIETIKHRFNSRAREGRDAKGTDGRSIVLKFQFTRPRGARQKRRLSTLSATVSIHAPARGATYEREIYADGSEFQFTRPRGARHWAPSEPHLPLLVSIHAPARGATSVPDGYSIYNVFQFTRPRGARPAVPRLQYGLQCFNSRAREGRDIKQFTLVAPGNGFNSRAREGRDLLLHRVRTDAGLVSIHAPARGATMIIQITAHALDVSIHAPARGATDTDKYSNYSLLFQFTRPRGARPPCLPYVADR